MKFIDKDVANLLKFTGLLLHYFAIVILIGVPIYILIFKIDLGFYIIFWILGVILTWLLGVLFGTVSELALDKLKRDNENTKQDKTSKEDLNKSQ